VHYAWKLARVKAGLPDAHFHDLRHAGLTLSAHTGAILAEVMRRAGHSSSAAPMRDQHAADQRDAEIAAGLSVLARDRLQTRQTPGT
jgi:integrase